MKHGSISTLFCATVLLALASVAVAPSVRSECTSDWREHWVYFSGSVWPFNSTCYRYVELAQCKLSRFNAPDLDQGHACDEATVAEYIIFSECETPCGVWPQKTALAIHSVNTQVTGEHTYCWCEPD